MKYKLLINIEDQVKSINTLIELFPYQFKDNVITFESDSVLNITDISVQMDLIYDIAEVLDRLNSSYEILKECESCEGLGKYSVNSCTVQGCESCQGCDVKVHCETCNGFLYVNANI